MIFINLLPNIKLDFVRAQRIRRLLVLLSVVIVLCCFVISSFLFFVVEIQQPATITKREGVCSSSQPASTDTAEADAGTEEVATEGDAEATAQGRAECTNEDLDPESNLGILKEIKSNEEGNTILTIQNQLQTLPDLHRLKTRPDRLFGDPDDSDDIAYLSLLIPKERGTIKTAEFDFETHNFMITGSSTDVSRALSVHANIRFMGYEECHQDKSNRNTRVYPFRINDEPIGDVGTAEDDITFTIEGVFSEQLFDREYSDKDLKKIGKVPDDAVDPAKLRDPNHPCKLPGSEERIDNLKFKKLEEWWKAN